MENIKLCIWEWEWRCTWRVKIIANLSRREHVCAFTPKSSSTHRCNLEKSFVESVNASLVSQVPSGFPRDTRARLYFTQRTYVYVHCETIRGGLFRNNAVVCKYSWKQCGRDLTFWDSYGSVSFFVYRRMYRSRKPRYLMQKRRCIPCDESGCCELFPMCVRLVATASARVSPLPTLLLCVMVSPSELLSRESKKLLKNKQQRNL